MTFTGLKKRIVAFSSNRADLNTIQNLLEKANISLTQVCRDTIPLKLVKNNTSGRKIFRKIENNVYVCVPTLILDDDINHIELDENLLDALALHILAGIEVGRAPAFTKMYWNIMDNHEVSLIDADLSGNVIILEDIVNNIEQVIIDKDDYESSTATEEF